MNISIFGGSIIGDMYRPGVMEDDTGILRAKLVWCNLLDKTLPGYHSLDPKTYFARFKNIILIYNKGSVCVSLAFFLTLVNLVG